MRARLVIGAALGRVSCYYLSEVRTARLALQDSGQHDVGAQASAGVADVVARAVLSRAECLAKTAGNVGVQVARSD